MWKYILYYVTYFFLLEKVRKNNILREGQNISQCFYKNKQDLICTQSIHKLYLLVYKGGVHRETLPYCYLFFIFFILLGQFSLKLLKNLFMYNIMVTFMRTLACTSRSYCNQRTPHSLVRVFVPNYLHNMCVLEVGRTKYFGAKPNHFIFFLTQNNKI